MRENKQNFIKECYVAYTVNMIGGKWKPILLYLISKGENRFGILQKKIEGISKHMLTRHLRELEADQLIQRKVYAQVPPKVEYFLTKKGESLFPIISAMHEWGIKNSNI